MERVVRYPIPVSCEMEKHVAVSRTVDLELPWKMRMPKSGQFLEEATWQALAVELGRQLVAELALNEDALKDPLRYGRIITVTKRVEPGDIPCQARYILGAQFWKVV